MPVSDPDVSRPRLIRDARFLEAGRREIATNLVGALAESMTIRGWGERRAGDGAPIVAAVRNHFSTGSAWGLRQRTSPDAGLLPRLVGV